MIKKTLMPIGAVAALSLVLLSCSTPSAQVTNSGSSSSKTNVPPAGQDEYRAVSVNVLSVDNKGTKVEARLETVDEPFKHPSLVPSRLTIRNLATNETIFEEKSDDTALSAYVRALNEEVGEALVVTWSGGSGDRIEILAVDSSKARVLLDERYRVDAALIDVSGHGQVDVLITTGDSGVGPFSTTRYVWNGDRFQPAGKVSYKSLGDTIERQFRPTTK
ncbi:MAG: hypothetical protein AABO57_08870 [Acidobacteriota bacterium]